MCVCGMSVCTCVVCLSMCSVSVCMCVLYQSIYACVCVLNNHITFQNIKFSNKAVTDSTTLVKLRREAFFPNNMCGSYFILLHPVKIVYCGSEEVGSTLRATLIYC